MKDITNTKFYKICYGITCTLTLICVVFVLATTDIGVGGFKPFFESILAVVGMVIITLMLRYLNEVMASVYAFGVCMRAYFYDIFEKDIARSKDCHEIYRNYHSMRTCFLNVKHAALSEIYSTES